MAGVRTLSPVEQGQRLFLARAPGRRPNHGLEYPSTLDPHQRFRVGLPEGTMGNSEVGHQNIGAGCIVDQESVAITKAVRNGAFFDNSSSTPPSIES